MIPDLPLTDPNDPPRSPDSVDASDLPEPADPTADLTEQEQMAVDFMKRPLRDVALELRRRTRAEDQALLRERYALGEMFLKVKDNPTVYGGRSGIQMDEFFAGRNLDLLREAGRIRHRYTPERFEQILAARNSVTGFEFSYDHLAILLAIEDDALADEFLNLTFADSWTCAELHRAVAKKLRASKPRSKKMPRSALKTFLGTLENISAVTGEWLRQHDEVWDKGQKVFDTYCTLPVESQTGALVKRLQELRDQAESAAEAQRNLADGFDRLRENIEATVHHRQQRCGGETAHPEGEMGDEGGADAE